MKKSIENNIDESKKEKIIQQALRTGGYLFPETPEEVSEFEKRFGNTDMIIPEELHEAPHPKVRQLKTSKISKKDENLAFAAREGSRLPDSILKKMKEDRGKSKKNKK